MSISTTRPARAGEWTALAVAPGEDHGFDPYSVADAVRDHPAGPACPSPPDSPSWKEPAMTSERADAVGPNAEPGLDEDPHAEPLTDGGPHAEPLLDGDPLPWSEVAPRLGTVGPCWLTVAGPDGSPHTRPVLAVWAAGTLHVAMSPRSVKARLLDRDPRCTLAAALGDLDVVVEGRALRVRDGLDAVAEAYAAAHGWEVEVRDGAFWGEGAPTAGPPPYEVRRLRPALGYAFGTTEASLTRATRWRFGGAGTDPGVVRSRVARGGSERLTGPQ